MSTKRGLKGEMSGGLVRTIVQEKSSVDRSGEKRGRQEIID